MVEEQPVRMTEYFVTSDGHMIWRREPDGSELLVMYVFSAQEAQIIIGMLNAALAYAELVTWDGREHDCPGRPGCGHRSHRYVRAGSMLVLTDGGFRPELLKDSEGRHE